MPREGKHNNSGGRVTGTHQAFPAAAAVDMRDKWHNTDTLTL